jgi:hypothetical protein
MTIKRDINKLIPPRLRGKQRLPALSGNRSIAASRGIGKPSASNATAGIASPLTERPNSRTFHTTTRTLRSTDGLFTLSYRNVKMVSMTDAASRPVVFVYDDYVPT